MGYGDKVWEGMRFHFNSDYTGIAVLNAIGIDNEL